MHEPDAFAHIQMPENDDIFSSQTTMEFTRGEGSDGSDTHNIDSHVIDASFVYGSSAEEGELLRDVIVLSNDGNGNIETTPHFMMDMITSYEDIELGDNGHMMPIDERDDSQFLAGDARGNIQPGLASLHTVFIREHNRIASTLKAELFGDVENSSLESCDIEYIFDESRMLVEAQFQKIIYEDWLPALTGRKLKYSSTQCETVSPRIRTWFANALFRFGHSMVNQEFWRLKAKAPIVDFVALNPNSKRHKTGPCRSSTKGKGKKGSEFKLYPDKSQEQCRQLCLENDTCLAFESKVNRAHERCEIWHVVPDYAKKLGKKKEAASYGACYVKTLVEAPAEEGSRLPNGYEISTTGHFQLATLLESNFFNSMNVFKEDDFCIEPVLAGLVFQPNQKIDSKVNDALRNHLLRDFDTESDTHTQAFDLVSLNIQRGRDFGIFDYNLARQHLVGEKVTEISDISEDSDLVEKLSDLYGNDVNNIDLFVGVLAEDHVPGASVGPTLLAGLESQFSLLQRGDCLWYKERLTNPIFEQERRRFRGLSLNSKRKDVAHQKKYTSPFVNALKQDILDGSRTLASIINDNTYLQLPKGYDVFYTQAAQDASRSYSEPSGDANDLYFVEDLSL
eukprot:Awhi_evm1s8154